jgi:putative hydrolase of the HAD superfamily
MIQYIVFDMGGVLLDFNPEQYIHEYLKDENEAALLNQEFFCGPEWPQTDLGTISDEDFLTGVKARLPERLHSVAEQLWEHWYDNLRPIESTYGLVKELKEKGYRIYLLSNTSTKYRIFCKQIPALQLFDGTFISADVHFNKPDKEIYQLFFQQFQLDPEECFFIDDREDNIAAGEQLGMRGFRFTQDMDALKCSLRNAGITL